MSSSRTFGTRPDCPASSERSINSRPSGTATESLGNPVTVERRSTLPPRPARSTLDVRGIDTPRTTTARTAPCVRLRRGTLYRSGVSILPTRRRLTTVGPDRAQSATPHDDEADRRPISRSSTPLPAGRKNSGSGCAAFGSSGLTVRTLSRGYWAGSSCGSWCGVFRGRL